MSQTVHERLKEMGVILLQPAAPVANYVPFVRSGNLLYISGQLPTKDGAIVKGCMGGWTTVAIGQEAAKLCALALLTQANVALGGNLDKIKRCVKLGGFVASTADFTDHPKVMNGASDFIVEALGDVGKHARFAVGVSALPFGALVEVDAIFEVAD